MAHNATNKIQSVQIGDRQVGPDCPVFIIGEIGINHNGDINLAKKLIDKAVQYGFNAVKFQKRTVDVVYTQEELARPRESPFGDTNGDLKRGLEFGEDEFKEIDRYCKENEILWFVSPWDEGSVDFTEAFNPPCYKVASPSLTDTGLLQRIKETGKPVILSSGMSTPEEVDQAIELFKGTPTVLLHCISTYPSKHEEINLSTIASLYDKYQIPIGYSGHEVDVIPSVFAVSGYGACVVERHITLDRSMWGSDHASSLEPRGMELLAKYIRLWPIVKGDGVKRLYESEVPIKAKLRRKG